jgi:hypothetical protein
MVIEGLGEFSKHLFSVVQCRFAITKLFIIFLVLLNCSAGQESSSFSSGEENVDPYMGDWQGSWTMAEGTGTDSGAMVAQVIALGEGNYRLNLLREFDTPSEPIAVLEGQREDTEVRFTGRVQQEGIESNVQAAIKDGRLTGTIKGHNSEGKYVSVEFILEKTVRLSPKLGEKPPENAIILFDGKNFDQWEQVGTFVGLISIAKVLGSYDNSAAYLKSSIWSATQQKDVLELGSDDGIKVWLNGQLIHSNNVMRGVAPAQDKVAVTLAAGWNELLLKVTNGSGGWATCARLVSEDGGKIENIKEKLANSKGTDEYLKKNNGFLTIWEIAGPYQEEGKDVNEIFDIVFEPEKANATGVKWRQVDFSGPQTKKVSWKLADGAMEIVPGTGSIVTKEKFNDFQLHIEFRTPFMPQSRGQGRGNSGVYLQGRYEVQILDSYGLEGLDNECGGIYEVGAPVVDMCAPPMQWQSYDITFRAPRFDDAGNKLSDATLTVVHNGVKIHDNLKVPNPTEASLDDNVTEPGGIYLQDHGNAVQYRNIWLVELPP